MRLIVHCACFGSGIIAVKLHMIWKAVPRNVNELFDCLVLVDFYASFFNPANWFISSNFLVARWSKQKPSNLLWGFLVPFSYVALVIFRVGIF